MSENKTSHSSKKLLQNRYQIIRQLSQTQNTERLTLLAFDIQTKKQVVIKVLKFNNNLRWEDIKLFEREAETLKTLSHPAIPGYLDYFEFDSSSEKGFALVQTYIKAKSLQKHLEEGRTFNDNEVKQLAKSLLEVLNYLHHRQPSVIHRDIKPSNILLANRSGNSPGDVYLVDFGAVQTTIREGSTRTIVGTYGYMPPEQFGGRATPASDLYSLGATLIYLLSRKHPADLLEDDLQIKFEQFCHISSDFENWLKLMTQPSLDRRLNSAQEALEALEMPNQSSTDNRLSVITKPDGSKVSVIISAEILQKTKISLTKSAESLQISFPQPSWFSLTFLVATLFLTISTIVIIVGIGDAFYYTLSFLNIMIVASLPLCFLYFKMWDEMSKRYKKKKLQINHKNIILTYQLFGSERVYIQKPRQDICKLVCNAKSYKLIKLNKEEGEMSTTTTEELAIWVGNTEIKIPTKNKIERDWLAQELSDWLGLPITHY